MLTKDFMPAVDV